jgi:4-hydroxy-tetrahydrodipicolinate reductase
MGKMLMEAVREDMGAALIATTARCDALEEVHTYLQREGLVNVLLTDDTQRFVEACDAVIDFTAPEYSMEVAHACGGAKVAYICGTTGFNEAQEAQLQQIAHQTVVVKSANFSIGVNLLLSLAQQVAAILDDNSDVEIIETHHRYKKDAPSGTALALGEAVAKGRGVTLASVADYGRNGITGERKQGAIGFHAVRGGDVIGDHTVLFASLGERIELTHKSSERRIYADGAIRAAKWAKTQRAGFYSMHEVLVR